MKLYAVVDKPEDRFVCGVIEDFTNEFVGLVYDFTPYKKIKSGDLQNPENFVTLDDFLLEKVDIKNAVAISERIFYDLGLDRHCRVWIEKEESDING